MHIILHQPEIPANTGNIGRTCVATGTSLHLIEPLGFRLNEKEIKRAGMDYWQHLDVTRYMNFQEFQELNSLSHRIYCTGGLLLHNSSAYVGDFAADFVRNFNADIMFFSSRGVSESGQITDASREETYIRQVMLQQSRKHIFLCDHNKIGQVYCYNLCNVSQLDDYIMFGKESAGIPEEILVEHEETCIRIPMLPEIRSLNLSNSVAIVLYEALRQQGFESMQRDGELHRLHWKE